MEAEENPKDVGGSANNAPLERAPGTVAILEAEINAGGIDYADAVAWGRKRMTANRERMRTTPPSAPFAGSKSQSRP